MRLASFVASMGLFASLTAPVGGQVMPSAGVAEVMSAPDRAIHVTIGQVPISEEDIRTLFLGIFAAAQAPYGIDSVIDPSQHHAPGLGPKAIETATKDRGEMPTGFAYFYYAGRDPTSGREIVWQAKWSKGESGNDKSDDEFMAAYALAALDAASVGEPWKTLYDRAPDHASRITLGKNIARAVDEASDQKKTTAIADATWIRQHIIVGLMRKDAYAELRLYGLVAYNSASSPGVPISKNGLKGCDFSDQSASAWPVAGEPLPKRTGDCAFFTNNPGAFPTAEIELDGAFSIGCGSEVTVAIAFDKSDRVKSVQISDPKWSCV